MNKKIDLLSGEMCISLINEPIDLTARFEVEPLTAVEIARRRWGTAYLIDDGRSQK